MMQNLDLIGYVAGCFLSILAVLVNYKLYTNIKNEEHQDKGKVIQYIIKVYSLVQCFAWPFLTVFCGLLYIFIAVLDIIEPRTANYLVSGFRFSYILLRDYLSFHSLIVAICRYTFIVLSDKSERFGILKLRQWIITSSMAVPLILAVLYNTTHPMENFYISFFYGTSAVQRTNYNSFDFKKAVTRNIYETPLYLLINKHLPSYLVYVLKCLEEFMFLAIYSNVIEGCLYAHAFLVLAR